MKNLPHRLVANRNEFDPSAVNFVRILLLSFCYWAVACTNVLESDNLDRLAHAPYVWTQFGADGNLLARAIVYGNRCPRIQIDSEARDMRQRSRTHPPGFESIQVCEMQIPIATRSASVNGTELAVGSTTMPRIVVLGDTGCRVKGTDIQNCTGKNGGLPWMFPDIVRAINQQNPDLIIHLGDYHYREFGQCDHRCLQQTIGSGWASWEADFFAPAKPILHRAPWIFVRGNHENCDRDGWQGWFYLLDPHPLTQIPSPLQHCVPHTKPYQVPFDRHKIVVMDTTDIPDDEFTDQPDPALVRQYAVDFDAISRFINTRDSYWLVGHRPIWAVATIQESSAVSVAPLGATLRSALQKSSLNRLTAPVDMILSGHVHLFESLNFADGRPRQFVFGAGGTERDPALTDVMLNRRGDILTLLKIERQNIDIYNNFSFGVIQRNTDRWHVIVKNTAGEDVFLFDVSNPSATD